MSYTPPNTFADGTILQSSELEGNYQELRKYLHSFIVAGDVEASQWIDTRHIQPPAYEAYSAVQHGVSGHQGGSNSGQTRLTFATKYLSGQGRTGSTSFHAIPGTAITLDLRRACTVAFTYWYELECGPDTSTGAGQVTSTERQVWIAPYVGDVSTAYSSYREQAQEGCNHQTGWASTTGFGAEIPYPLGGAYQSRDGTLIYSAPNGRITFGLAAHSRIDRVAVVNWGVAVESFYL
jgi:hypothetical protein